jgi:hypothetical protein
LLCSDKVASSSVETQAYRPARIGVSSPWPNRPRKIGRRACAGSGIRSYTLSREHGRKLGFQ